MVFEQRTVETSKKAMKIGIITAVAMGLLTVIIVFSFPPPENKMAKDDMGMLQRSKSKKEDAEKKESAPAPAATDTDKGSESATPPAGDDKPAPADEKSADSPEKSE